MPRVVVSPEIEQLATHAVDAAFLVHKEFGPGLLESAYRECMAIELQSRGLTVEREYPCPSAFAATPYPTPTASIC